MICFFAPEIFKFSYYANLATDDVISCTRTVAVWDKIKNISANNEAMLLKLGRNVAPYKIYQMVHILMLLWQHTRFQSPASLQWNITICDSTRQKNLVLSKTHASPTFIGSPLQQVYCIFCPVQVQMVTLAGTKHVAIATSKCVPSDIFLRVQHLCQISIELLHYWQRYS